MPEREPTPFADTLVRAILFVSGAYLAHTYGLQPIFKATVVFIVFHAAVALYRHYAAHSDGADSH